MDIAGLTEQELQTVTQALTAEMLELLGEGFRQFKDAAEVYQAAQKAGLTPEMCEHAADTWTTLIDASFALIALWIPGAFMKYFGVNIDDVPSKWHVRKLAQKARFDSADCERFVEGWVQYQKVKAG